MSEDVPSLSEQEESGLYEEELNKLVDGVVEDVRSRPAYTKDDAASQLRAAVQRSNYVLDETLALHVLKHSGKPWHLLDAALKTMADCAQEELEMRQEYKNLF
jgi:hypothetical protein